MTGFLDVAAAARFLCRSPRWIRQHVNEIPHFRPGGQILFDETDLRKWLLRFKVEPQDIDIRGLVDRVVRPSRPRGGRGRFKSGEGRDGG